MSETVDMILDGALCVQCGVLLPGEAPGHARYCSTACRRAATADKIPVDPSVPKMLCPVCGKKIKVAGQRDHMRAVHST